ESIDLPRHVLRYGLRAAASELSAGRTAAVHPLLRPGALLRRLARLPPIAVGHVQRGHADLDRARRCGGRLEAGACPPRCHPARERSRRLVGRSRRDELRGAPLARGACAGAHRSDVRVEGQQELLRVALRQQRVRRPVRVPAPSPQAGSADRGCRAVGAHRPRRAARVAARRERALERAPGGPTDVILLRRHRLGAGALVLAALATLLVLFAFDARSWQSSVRRDDIRFRALPDHGELWKPSTILPGDPAGAVLNTGDTVAWRRALQSFWYTRVGSNPKSPEDLPKLRALTQA